MLNLVFWMGGISEIFVLLLQLFGVYFKVKKKLKERTIKQKFEFTTRVKIQTVTLRKPSVPLPDENPSPCATGNCYSEFLILLNVFPPLYASLNSICGLSFNFMENIYETILDAYRVHCTHDVICDVSLDHVVKVISARFLHYKGTIFLFPCTVILSKT